MSGDEWRKQARCRGTDTNLFFAERGGDSVTYAQALEVCNGAPVEREKANSDVSFLIVGPPCPVRAECLAFVMEVEDASFRYGIFGGLSPNDRDTLGRYDRTDWCRVETDLRAGKIVVGSRADSRRRRADRLKQQRQTEPETIEPTPVPVEEPSAVYTVPDEWDRALPRLFELLRSARNEVENQERTDAGHEPIVYRYED